MEEQVNISNLWRRFVEGDDYAYAQIYNLCGDDMLVYGLHFTSDRELVKDCMQDVFVDLYKRRRKLEKKMDNVKCYLFIALKNKLFDAFKKSVEFYQIETLEPVFHTEYTVEDLFIRSETNRHQRAKIKEILQRLTPRQHEVIYYRYVEEMSYEEIGKLMQMNVQSVRNLLSRSIQRARDFVSEYVFSLILLFQLFWS